MRFIIADTFLRSLEKLDGESQKLVKQAAFEFQLNPANPGFQFHKLDRAKDKRFSSARVNRDIRLIIHRDGASSLMLCYVDHHDAAYAWAERRVLDVHPTTGAIQLVEVEERVEEVVRRVVREEEAPLFAKYEQDYLSALGVPAQWMDAVRSVGESAFLDLAVKLPTVVSERLLDLTEGKPVPRPVAVPVADAYQHPDSQRHFRVMESRDELSRALDAPWDQWLVFLHPDQRRYASADYQGPARVSGGAGTGKTVVAVHRAVRLAREGRGRVLLTTFSKTLGSHLSRQVGVLAGDSQAVRDKLEIRHLHRIATDLLRERTGKVFVPAEQDTIASVLRQAAAAHGEDPDFALEEFLAVVDAQGITDFEQYRDAPRVGRGTPLGLKRRRTLFRVFEAAQERISASGQRSWNGLCAEVTALLARDGSPYAHVVADEAQDFGPAELKLIRALAAPGTNDVFLCGDEAQRIYRPRFAWSKLGLDVRGRSHRLKVNYRTTAEIRRQADRLLPERVRDVEGDSETRATISHLSGPIPELTRYDSLDDEREGLIAWLRHRAEEGIPLDRIAVFARTDALLSERVRPALQHAGLPAHEIEETTSDGGGVNIGTMHRAKGLEFRAVAVVGCDAANLPSPHGLTRLADPADRAAYLERERNLLYVACTRAREHLRLSWIGEPAECLS